jgi:hypothetical protein
VSTVKSKSSLRLRLIGTLTILCGWMDENRYHKTLSELIVELELYGFVDVERKGRDPSRGVEFYISRTGSIERKVFLDALKDLVV